MGLELWTSGAMLSGSSLDSRTQCSTVGIGLGTGTRAEPFGEEAAPLEEVFEDKEAVHVKTVCAQHPQQTMSEKTHGGIAGCTSRWHRHSCSDQVGERQAAATVVSGNGNTSGGGNGQQRGVLACGRGIHHEEADVVPPRVVPDHPPIPMGDQMAPSPNR